MAILLLASVPTIGRLLAPTIAAQGHAHHAKADMPGMAMPAVSDASHVAPPRPLHPTHRHDDDCAYCALLGTTLPIIASALALPPALLPPLPSRPWRAPLHRALPRGAPGSRGPPART